MKIIGITGNSGSGKSAVCKILKERGAYIIDADAIAREVVMPGEPALMELVEYFGDVILMEDGTLNRKRLSDIAFAQEEKRQALIGITHRHILERMYGLMRDVKERRGGYRFIALDAPLLIEAGLHEVCDSVWLVEAPREVMKRRIIERDGITESQADMRLNVQPPHSKLRAYAHSVVVNDSTEEMLEQNVAALIRNELELE